MQVYAKKYVAWIHVLITNIVHISMVSIYQMIFSGGISNRNGNITAITRIPANLKCKYPSHSASTALIQQVPFYGLYFDEQVPSLQIRITVLFGTDLQTPRTALPGFPATLPVFRNVSTHFFFTPVHTQLLPH